MKHGQFLFENTVKKREKKIHFIDVYFFFLGKKDEIRNFF